MRKFTENEIPYEDFERMGFSQEMIDVWRENTSVGIF